MSSQNSGAVALSFLHNVGQEHGIAVAQFVQHREAEPGVDNSLHNFADSVVPLPCRRVAYRGRVAVGVRGGPKVEQERLGRLEGRVCHDEQVVMTLFEAPKDRVVLMEVEESPRSQKTSRDLRPACDVREPVEGARPGVDNVKALRPRARP